MNIKEFFQKLHFSNKPNAGMRLFTLEGEDPDQPVKSLYESQVHPSVFEENLGSDHPNPHFNKAVFSWIAPEYHQHPKSAEWWAIGGVVMVIAIILEAFSGNWSMLLATITFGLVYWYLQEHHPPKYTKINISEVGIKIGHQTIHYAEIESFWIIENEAVKKLFLRLKGRFLPDLVIELEKQDSQAIRSFLGKYLTEIVGVKETLGDLIIRILKI